MLSLSRRARVLAALLMAGLVAPQALQPARSALPPPGGPVAPPGEGAWLGAYVEKRWPAEQLRADIEALEARLGRRLAIDHFYVPFTRPFPTWREHWDFAAGRLPLISWGGVSTAAVNSGIYDALIRSRAAGVKALGKPVLLEWFWEMDGKRNLAMAISPQSFIAAWRRIHGIFRQQGATNAAFVWCPNSFTFPSGEAPRWYPGDFYADWLCANGFNWAPGVPGADWKSFEETFRAFYDWASPRGKPLLIGEFGVQERAPGEKARWLWDAWNTLKHRFPAIKAVVYFHTDRRFDWRVGTSEPSFQAFRSMAQADYFQPAPAGPPPPGNSP